MLWAQWAVCEEPPAQPQQGPVVSVCGQGCPATSGFVDPCLVPKFVWHEREESLVELLVLVVVCCGGGLVAVLEAWLAHLGAVGKHAKAIRTGIAIA